MQSEPTINPNSTAGTQKPCVLIISLYPTHPPKGGRMIRLLQLARAVRAIGYRPILLFQDFAGGDMAAMREFWGADLHFVPYRSDNIKWRLKRMIRDTFPPTSFVYKTINKIQNLARSRKSVDDQQEFQISLDDLYDNRLTCHIHSICESEKPKAVVCLEVFMTKGLENLPPSIYRILDTNDIYAVGREANDNHKLWVNLGLEDELKGFRRVDLVWAIQKKDEEKIRRAAPDLNVGTVGHLVDLAPADAQASLKSRNILLVASKHKWNVQGLRWFATEVYPLLKDKIAAKNVVIAGDISDVLQGEMPFNFLGRVGDLGAVYADARVVISPILGGAGLKIKSIEPMGHGKAVVSTREAALGLEAAENRAYLKGADAASFAAAILRLMEDDALCQKLMKGSFEFAKEWNEEVLTALKNSFEQKRRTGGTESSESKTTYAQSI